MSSISNNNRRIARNTLMLYFRMAFTMGLGFFATRYLLIALGVSDYGLTNVIGGVVAMFTVVSGTLATAVSRFFNFEQGKGNRESLKNVVNLSQIIYLFLTGVFFLAAESIGLWILQNKIIIPEGRVDAVFWFYQFSVFALLVNILSIPFSALIISHENMKLYSLISVFSSASRLAFVLLLITLGGVDRLFFYGLFLFLIELATLLLYVGSCWVRYPESRFRWFWKKEIAAEIILFGWWNLWGAVSLIIVNASIGVFLNNFFGPSMNASFAVASQITAGTSAFVNGFLVASIPSLTKYYAQGMLKEAFQLVGNMSRVSFILLIFIVLPIWISMEFVLSAWLDDVPSYALWFSRLALLQLLIEVLSNPIKNLMQATGKIALFVSLTGLLLCAAIPLSFACFSLGGVPESFLYVGICLNILCFSLRIFLAHRIIDFPVKEFMKNSIFPVILLFGVVALFCGCFSSVFKISGTADFFVVIVLSWLLLILCLFFFILNEDEKIWLTNKIKLQIIRR